MTVSLTLDGPKQGVWTSARHPNETFILTEIATKLKKKKKNEMSMFPYLERRMVMYGWVEQAEDVNTIVSCSCPV